MRAQLKVLFSSLLDTIKLLFDKFLQHFWILLLLALSIYIIWANWHNIIRFGLPEYGLIKDYLSTWPPFVFILVLFFLFKFEKSIKTFLENSRPENVGPIGVTQIATPNPEPPIETEPAGTNRNQQIVVANQRAEEYEFRYLNLNIVLVPNTKAALFWIYLRQSHPISKPDFLSTYILILPPNPVDLILEKEAIIAALLTNQLISSENNFLTVTEKGIRFLQFIGKIPMQT
jgi:hypothetical protein